MLLSYIRPLGIVSVIMGVTLSSGSAFAVAFLNDDYEVSIVTAAPGESVDLTTQSKQEIQKDQPVKIMLNDPQLIQLDDRIPVILVPVKSGINEVKVDPPTIKDATQHLVQGEISKNIAEIIQGIEEAKSLLRRKEYDAALNRVQQIQAKYPKVAFLEFVKASIYLVQGRKADARTAASIGLKSHPDFEDAKKFLQSIGAEQ